MKKGLTTLLLLIWTMVLLLGSVPFAFAQDCDDPLGCVQVGADDPLTIAYMLTISGATSFLGEDSRGGIEIAIDDRGGEVLGHEIELVGEDSLCSAEGGQAAAQRLTANDAVVGIIGTNCSSASVSALPIVSEAGHLMISPSATSPRLSTDNPDEDGVYQPGFYRTAHNDLFQGAVAAEFIFHELGATTLATIHDGSPYADGLQQVMAETFTELGGEVTFQGAVNVGDTDMTAILTEIATNPPDVLYFPIFEPEGNFIAAQARQTPGLEEVALMGADGILVDSFPEATGDAAIGMYFSGPSITSEAYQDFIAKWEEKFGTVPPSVFHAHAYDATNILLNAVEAVAVQNDDGSLTIGRQALRDAITATAEFEGLTGVLGCDEFGDCATGEALGIFQLGEAEVFEGNWPPALIWSLSDLGSDHSDDGAEGEDAEGEEAEGEEDSD